HGSPPTEPPIAFTRLSRSFWSLESVGADGSGARHLVDIARADARLWASPLDALGQADWSPDRLRLAFTCVTTSSSICVSDADGGNAIVLRLPSGLVDAVDPDWSPDGNEIAFAGVTSTSPIHSEIYVMDAEGGHVHAITRGSPGGVDPSWS